MQCQTIISYTASETSIKHVTNIKVNIFLKLLLSSKQIAVTTYDLHMQRNQTLDVYKLLYV